MSVLNYFIVTINNLLKNLQDVKQTVFFIPYIIITLFLEKQLLQSKSTSNRQYQSDLELFYNTLKVPQKCH